MFHVKPGDRVGVDGNHRAATVVCLELSEGLGKLRCDCGAEWWEVMINCWLLPSDFPRMDSAWEPGKYYSGGHNAENSL